MDLSPRHRMILKVLIDDFVIDNRPVGSKTLTEKYDLGLSPATIRNCFRDLEEAGLINSKHHSGGRIPTEKGYRIYVDNLLIMYELTLKEKQRIQEEYLKNQFKLEQILLATCRVLSLLTSNASVVLAPEQTFDSLKHLELIHVTGDEVLMIIVTRSGQVINKNLFLEGNMSQESLYQISKFLNQNLMGQELDEIFRLIPELAQSLDSPEDFRKISKSIQSGFSPDDSANSYVYIDGLKNLVDNFKDEENEKLDAIFKLLDDKKQVRDIFSKYIQYDGVTTYISENEDDQIKGFSIVAANYRLGEKRIGAMGVLGPVRMNYNRNLPLVEFTSKLVSEMITRISK
ncbi:MAG: heat-inducible transcriptional repressor HrcA [Leptospiraceae bacterium]|nr:heat-inducible transcriptional repressor HrcA [Leptospiraceae bacterium]